MASLRTSLAAMLLAGSLTACGGGGGGGGSGSACASGDIFATFSYRQGLFGNVGTLLSSTPEIQGVPASCTRDMRFTLVAGSLPPGTTLDSTTGVVSGRPTTSGSYFFDVRMSVNNFRGFLSGGITAQIKDPAAFSFGGWELMTESAPFLDDFRIGAVGGKLYVVSRGFYTHVVETYESSDGGATWTLLPLAGPTGDLRAFALASDGTHIYLSGGSDGSVQNSGVWRFDGSAWTQMTPAAAFPAREGHSMLNHGGALYVLGGRVGSTDVDDTWRSTDAGTTWTRTSPSGFGPRRDFCAVSDGASFIYALGGSHPRARVRPSGPTASDLVFRTMDGVVWTPVPVSTTSPLMTALETLSGSCALLAGRLVYVGDRVGLDGTGTVSSADGTNWNYEPHRMQLSGLSPGAVTLGGRLYVTAGSGTSQRSVLRTIP